MANGAIPLGACAALKTTSADRRTAVLACLAQLLADRAHGHRAVLRFDDDPQVRTACDAWIDRDHEIALLRLQERTRLRSGPIEQVAGATRELAQEHVEHLLEVRALRRGSGTLGATGGGGRLDRNQALLDGLEPAADLLAELVHRRVQPRRVEQHRELRGVAVEVALEHPADPPDRAVALRLVEQLVDHGAQGAAIPEEPLEGSRQAAVPVREVRAQRLLERQRGAFVHLLGLAQDAFELGANNVDVDAHPRVLERDQPDPQGALDKSRPIVGRAIGKRRGERRVVEHEAVHDDPVAQHLDAGRAGDASAVDGSGTSVLASMARTVPAARDI